MNKIISSVAGGAINDRSQVVYRPVGPHGTRTAIWENGHSIMVEPTSRSSKISGFAINSRNEIAGQVFGFSAKPATSRAFMWRNGEMIDVGTLGGSRASATRINDRGMIAGWAPPPGKGLADVRAFIWKNGIMKDLGTLGGPDSRAYGLNLHGDVVGYSYTKDNRAAAFLFERNGDRMIDLNDCIDQESGWALRSADDINDGGQILVTGRKDGTTRAVLLNPIDHKFALRKAAPDPSDAPTSRAPTPAPFTPGFSALERLSDGSVRLSIPSSGDPGEFGVEYSTDLREWKPLGRPMRQSPQIQFTDPEAAQSPIRFYRVVRLSGSAR